MAEKGPDDGATGSGSATFRPDPSLLQQPIQLGLTGLHQLLQCYKIGTEEIKHSLMHECEIIMECKVCRSLYRGLPNFLAHKRHHCTNHYPGTLVRFQDLLSKEDETQLLGSALRTVSEPSSNMETDFEEAAYYRNIEKVGAAVAATRSVGKIIQLDTLPNTTSAVSQTLSDMECENVSKKRVAKDDLEGHRTKLVKAEKSGKIKGGYRSQSYSGLFGSLPDFYKATKLCCKNARTCLVCQTVFGGFNSIRKHIDTFHLSIKKFFICKYCPLLFRASHPEHFHDHLLVVHGLTENEADNKVKTTLKIQKYVQKDRVFDLPGFSYFTPRNNLYLSSGQARLDQDSGKLKDGLQSIKASTGAHKEQHLPSPTEKPSPTLDRSPVVAPQREDCNYTDANSVEFKRNQSALYSAVLTTLDVIDVESSLCKEHPYFVFATAKALRLHFMNEHVKEPYTCPICPETFSVSNSFNLFTKHLLREHGIHENTVPQLRHKLKASLLRPESDNDEGIFPKEENQESPTAESSSPSDLLRKGGSVQEKSHHPIQYLCRQCNKAFSNFAGMSSHMKILHKMDEKSWQREKEILKKIAIGQSSSQPSGETVREKNTKTGGFKSTMEQVRCPYCTTYKNVSITHIVRHAKAKHHLSDHTVRKLREQLNKNRAIQRKKMFAMQTNLKKNLSGSKEDIKSSSGSSVQEKYQCSQCDKTCFNIAGMSMHMKVIHKMNEKSWQREKEILQKITIGQGSSQPSSEELRQKNTKTGGLMPTKKDHVRCPVCTTYKSLFISHVVRHAKAKHHLSDQEAQKIREKLKKSRKIKRKKMLAIQTKFKKNLSGSKEDIEMSSSDHNSDQDGSAEETDSNGDPLSNSTSSKHSLAQRSEDSSTESQDIKSYSCPKCKEIFTNIINVYSHMQEIHGTSKNDWLSAVENIKNNATVVTPSMTKRQQSMKTGETKPSMFGLDDFKCPYCMFETPNIRNLRKHLKTKHNLTEEESEKYKEEVLDKNKLEAMDIPDVENPSNPEVSDGSGPGYVLEKGRINLQTGDGSIYDNSSHCGSEGLTERADQSEVGSIGDLMSKDGSRVSSGTSQRRQRSLERGEPLVSMYSSDDLQCPYCYYQTYQICNIVRHAKEKHKISEEEANKLKEELLKRRSTDVRDSVYLKKGMNAETPTADDEEKTKSKRRKQLSPSKTSSRSASMDDNLSDTSETSSHNLQHNECDNCHRVFKSEESLLKHQTRICRRGSAKTLIGSRGRSNSDTGNSDPNLSGFVKIYNCGHCDKKFSSSISLSGHQNLFCKKDIPKSRLLTKSRSSSAREISPVRDSDQAVQGSSPEISKVVRCWKCSKDFTRVQTMMIHMKYCQASTPEHSRVVHNSESESSEDDSVELISVEKPHSATAEANL